MLWVLLLAVACRKDADPPAAKAVLPPPPAPEIAKAVRAARPVIFVGIEAADWELLDGFMASGVMPNLNALAREGRTGELAPVYPAVPPLVWTTMMTGVSPLEHRILDLGAASGERQVPAVWNMASEGGKSAAVFGMPATWPAEPIRGLIVADRPESVYPPEQEAWARETLAEPDRPEGEEPDPLAAVRSWHALATSWLGREKSDLVALYFPGPVLGEDGNPDAYFAEIDHLLGDYRKLAESRGAVLMIASGHGLRSRKGRPTDGIYLLWGPDVEKSANRDHGEAAQVAPTLLALLGLPPGRGLNGPPLSGVESPDTPPADYRAHFRPGTATPETTRTAGSYNNEGLLRRERGETDAAAQAYEEALKIDPKNASALWNLSDLLHSGHRDLDRSDELLIQSLDAGLPEGVDNAMGRTVAYARGGDAPRGLKLLDRALVARPKEPRLHLLRGRYRLERRQCEKALGDFESAARFDPKNALAFASMGIAQLCVGDGDGATQSFRRSLRIDPNQPEIRRALRQAGAR
ncbi:MAG: tetratricopeptide repeat protein [Thermoanaerobaculia bacterium]